MLMTALKKYLLIMAANLKHNFLPHIALSALILLITPVIFGTANLDAKAAAVPLEMFVALIGIILITPVFLPEQQKEIKDVLESKYTGQNSVCFVRLVVAIITMLIFIFGFVFYMKMNGCDFEMLPYILGIFAEGLFLGSLGLFCYGMSDNIATGYMVPMVYYIINFGKYEYLGKFYLFSMRLGSITEKYWLFSTGTIIIIITLSVKYIIGKIR